MSYRKGVLHERSLIRFLNIQGFSTLRVAGSGHSSPIDILALKKGQAVALECKAHAKKPYLSQAKIQEMRAWCDRAGALGFLAWRPPQKDWLFLPLENMEQKQYEDEHWLPIGNFLKILP